MLFDLRYAVRQLCRAPIFTITALATLGLCVGANVLIFSVVHAVLLKPLPFPRPDELVRMVNNYPKAEAERLQTSVPNYFEFRDGVPAFAEVGAIRGDKGMVDLGGGPRQTWFARATPSFFRVLEISAAKGRLFSEEEGAIGMSTASDSSSMPSRICAPGIASRRWWPWSPRAKPSPATWGNFLKNTVPLSS